MRLIDADELIQKAYIETEGMDESYKDFGILVEWLVDKIPTIHQAQKNGEWRHRIRIIDGKKFEGNYCSECGGLQPKDGWIYFCSRCGAQNKIAEE